MHCLCVYRHGFRRKGSPYHRPVTVGSRIDGEYLVPGRFFFDAHPKWLATPTATTEFENIVGGIFRNKDATPSSVQDFKLVSRDHRVC